MFDRGFSAARTQPSTIPVADSCCRTWLAAVVYSEIGLGKCSLAKERRPVSRKLGLISAVTLSFLLSASSVGAQIETGVRARPRVNQIIDETNRVALAGNTH